MSEQKFQPGDQVSFFWDSMHMHNGEVKAFHGNAVDSKPIYSVWDVTDGGLEVVRYLFEHEMVPTEAIRNA
jgi:hypothetical protein